MNISFYKKFLNLGEIRYMVFISLVITAIILNSYGMDTNTNREIRIQIIIFSGRPNPVLTVRDSAEISDILNALKEITTEDNQTSYTQSMEELKKFQYFGLLLDFRSANYEKLRYIRLANGFFIDEKNKKTYKDYLKMEHYLTKRVLNSSETVNQIKNPKTLNYINKKIKE